MRLVYRDRVRPHSDRDSHLSIYFRIGAMPLTAYLWEGDMILASPPGRMEKIPPWRSFWDRRKPWKVVQPGWMEHILNEMGHELSYGFKPPAHIPWTVRWRAHLPGTTYANNNINDMLHVSTGNYAAIHKYDFGFMTDRKPWKVLTREHIECVIKNLGGEIA